MEKRILVAIILSIGVLVGFQYFQSLTGGGREVGREEAAAPKKDGGKPADVAQPAEAAMRPVGGGASLRGTMVKVETPLYTAVLASEGGGRIVRWDLKRYHAKKSNGQIGLVAERDELPLTLRIPGIEGAALPFSVDREELVLKEGGAPQVLLFQHSTSAGRVERRLTFHPETYQIDVETTVLGYPSYAVSLGSNTAVIDDLDSGNWNVSVGPAARIGRDLKRESLTKGSGSDQVSGEAEWAAIEDKYFVMAAVPAKPRGGVRFEFEGPRQATLHLAEGAQKPADLKPGDPLTAVLDASGRVVRVERQRGVAVPSRNDGERIVVGKVAAVSGAQGTLQLETRHIARVVIPGAAGSAPDKIRVYLGPKERDRLAQMNAHVEDLVDFGWFTVLALPMFWVMKWIHGVFGNYGVAIILLTALLKLIFFYPTHLSYKSMKRMQDIQPKVLALKEKYKNDQTRMNQEMMEIYRKHKVNPMGGCLPMVIQVPFFVGLYNIFSLAIELRQAPFAGWILDLSDPDPYYVLPILMGASMLASQKLTPTTVDPTQAKVMLILPVIFTFMFISFPSGLVLYWTVNNILTIGQQIYINRSPAK